MRPTPGLHHVTVVGGDPNRNVAFYRGVLGLRLVKKTINYEDPAIFHFYYECGAGGPGTILTFFLGRVNEKQPAVQSRIAAVSLAVARGSMGKWRAKIERAGVDVKEQERCGQSVLALRDPDGTALELSEAEQDGNGIVGLSGISVRVPEPAATVGLLRECLGLVVQNAGKGWTRLSARDPAALGRDVELVQGGEARSAQGRLGPGSIHHAAFRADDERHQADLRGAIVTTGRDVTPVIDRTYFRSVYFYEPGGAKLEVATDGPGFGVDEEELGGRLVLPARWEPERARIEAGLHAAGQGL